MADTIPTQCPECGAFAVSVRKVPPTEHTQGEGWATFITCENCAEFSKWL